MKRFYRINILPFLMALFVFAVLVGLYDDARDIYRHHMPAVEWIGVHVMTPTVRPGEVLIVEYTERVNKLCPADLRGFLIDADGAALFRFPTVAGGYTKPSLEPLTVRVSIQIPKVSDIGVLPFEGGPVKYRTIATRFCPEGTEEDTTIPDASFILETS